MDGDRLIGTSVKRVEDLRFLTGKGRYVTDMAIPGALHCRIKRSEMAHAEIGGINIDAALACPGVVAVFTGEDLAADGVKPVDPMWRITSGDGSPMRVPVRWAIARDRVRYVGEPVAIVLAESVAAADDGMEAISVDYRPLDPVTQSDAAIAEGAPDIHPEAPGNIAFHWQRGDREKVDALFAEAAHITKIDIFNNRICGAAIENRACAASWDPITESLTLYDATQTPHNIRRLVSKELGLAEGKVRVISPDMGGGFGYKGKHYPEETIVGWAARRTGRPVVWNSGRTEGFLSDTQGRDHITHAELALDQDGKFLAVRVDTLANLGGYISTYGAAIPSAIYSALLAGVYTTQAVWVEVKGVLTNTVPTDAYRGAGRPEACLVLERLADKAASELGLDRMEIRKRNLIPVDAMPYTTPIGPTYDCGDFDKVMSRTMEIADLPGFDARRADSEARGFKRGLGIANYVESSGVAPSRLAGAMGAENGLFESAEVRVDSSGGVQVMLGTHNHGQGHQTSFAQIVADRLGVPFENIEIVEGDTGAIQIGTGTFGSRSIAVGGSAMSVAMDKVVEKGRHIAAHLLEAAAEDIAFEAGAFSVSGTDRSISFQEVAHAAYVPHNYPLETLEPGLVENAYYDPANFAFSNGTHVCEIEIDPETGTIRIDRYFAVDDVGTVINPMIVHGQIHGGLAQGIGQALMEDATYDDASGQMLAASFMDYCLPRADDMSDIVSELDESQPCTHNPLGAKGCGESGTIGAPAALTSAVLDALGPLGVTDVQMPLTPARVWQAIQDAAA